jgi:hypothetical protein
MSTMNLDYLYMVIGAVSVFAAVLAWTEWYSNHS